MKYTLKPTTNFLKQLKKLDKSIKDEVNKKLEKIKKNPNLSKPLKHEPHCFSERVRNYRVIFEVKGGLIVLYRVRKREKAY